jgi:hypothetical protein
MRRRRNELEYPAFPDETVEEPEVTEVVSGAKNIIDAARRLLGPLGLF